MKHLLLIVCLIAMSLNATAQSSDKDLVYAAIEDYVDALYLVQPERIQRSVHPNLSKKGFSRPKDKTEYGPEMTMTYQQLYDLAGKWNAKGKLPKDAPKKIEIFDVQDKTAVGKLTAQWGTDYFHLAKYDGKWMITNVLWQSHPVRNQ
ncbi:nuclear transport factor 2 family protein [Chryseosolibacter indicus]|uniref:Nuclear transport factor 2 family protein n=1 Tax=Chryseosolibacter indicus TaxID=2782351 RepID=A0ABS5VW63_9BACT|nr:nuclear transport factor 2 family protein [Chryseosolibacter indicus]MBT1705675.1 nuclear transport factor 2 family protein [Chryseosolibacter indicus]